MWWKKQRTVEEKKSNIICKAEVVVTDFDKVKHKFQIKGKELSEVYGEVDEWFRKGGETGFLVIPDNYQLYKSRIMKPFTMRYILKECIREINITVTQRTY